MISRPVSCRGSRAAQFFFVNGRAIRSRLLTAAVEEAYRNRRMVGKFPACVVQLTLPLGEVDVNVHPAKTEVKFLREREVFDAVHHAVKAALDQDGAIPAAETPRAAVPTPREDFFRQMTAAQLRQTVTPKTPVVAKPDEPIPYTALHSPVRKPADALPLRDSGTPRPEKPVTPSVPAPEPEESAPMPASVPWRVVGELFRTYVVVEQGEEILLIDKHAAHERVNFDRLRAQGYTPMAQTLITPLVLTVSDEAGDALLGQEELLEQFGFAVESFGDGSLLVRQVPADLDLSLAEDALLEIGAALASGRRADPAAARDAMLGTIACKAAIKAGQRNGPAELEAVARAVLEEGVRYCPHGRPVSIRMTRAQLEKQFGRS